MTRREPERMIHRTAFLAFGHFREGRRSSRFLPGLPSIGRAKDRRAQMACAGGHQDRPSVAWVKDDVMDDMAEECGPGNFPPPSRPIALECECPLSGSDQQRNRTTACRDYRLHRTSLLMNLFDRF